MKNRKIDFTRKRFNALLLTSTFSMAIESLVLLSDNIVVGHIVGENGIAGINLVTSIFAVVAFVGLLISMGSSFVYTREMGQFHKEQADRIAGQGLIVSFACGLLMFLLVFFGEDLYFSAMGAGGEVLKWARDYYSFFRFTVFLYPLYCYLVDMVYADGDEKVCVASYLAQIVGNILLSIVLTIFMGTAGASLGTLIGTILSLLILFIHFISPKCALKFKPYFNLKSIFEVFRYSLVDAGIYLFWGILSIAVNKLVIAKFGEYYLAALSVLISTVELSIVLDGLPEAFTPLFNMFKGEENYTGVRHLLKIARETAMTEGLVFTVFLEVFAGFVPLVFNIQDPELIRVSALAVRIYVATGICSALIYLYTSYYLMMGHLGISILVIGLTDAGFPILFSLIFTSFMGFQGISLAMMISPVLALLAGALLSRKCYGQDVFPDLIPSSLPPTFLYSLELKEDQIMMARDQIEKDLTDRKVSRSVINQIMLLTEDGLMTILKKNAPDKEAGKKGSGKPVLCEVSVKIEEKIQVVIKDNGIVFDMIHDEEAPVSLQNYVIQSLSGKMSGSRYLLTSSFNRHMFYF